MARLIIRSFPRLTLFLPLLLASCAVMLVGPYDPVTDAALQDLAKNTEIFIADVTLSHDSYSERAKFYREAEGSLRAIEMRASLYPKNEAELELLAKLRAAFGNLRSIHQEVGPFRQREAEGVRSLLRSLLHHELSKKRSAGVGAPAATP
ncbi:MAG TPA: hypothetical protein VK474_11440 [Chthoniobacterales bacterium]|nr:hypothetical protein [Chthoniobacterales bacterium]